MPISYLLAIVSMLIIISIILISTTPKKHCLIGVLLLLPFLDLPIVPVEYGGFKVFHGASFCVLFIFFNEITSKKIILRQFSILFVFLILVLSIGSFYSKFPINSVVAVLSLFSIFAFASLLYEECERYPEFELSVRKSLLFACLFSIAFLLLQIIFGLDFTFYMGLNKNTENLMGFRYPSFFHDPQKYGHFLCLTGFLFLYNKKQPNVPKSLSLIIFLFVVAALLATGSRSSFMGMGIGILFLCFFLGMRYRIFVSMIIGMGFLIQHFFSESIMILSRSKTIDDDFLIRASIWDEALLFFKSSPLFGIGFGNYHNFSIINSENFYINEGNEVIFFDQPESGYWMLLTECGIIGFIILSIFLILPVFSKVKSWFYGVINFNDVYCIAGLISWLVAFTTVYSLSDMRILIVVTCLLVFLSIDNRKSPYGI